MARRRFFNADVKGTGSTGYFFFQAEDGIRDLVRSRGLGDVYKRQVRGPEPALHHNPRPWPGEGSGQ